MESRAGARSSMPPFQLAMEGLEGTRSAGEGGPTCPRSFDGMQGKIKIDPMITHVMPLAEVDDAFELMSVASPIRGW